MAKETEIDYEYLVQDALRCVIRDVLSQASREGLPGDHHFYIAFQISDRLSWCDNAGLSKGRIS